MESPNFQVRLSATLQAQLKAEAASRGLKPTELVRLLVVNFLDQHRQQREYAEKVG